MSPRSASVNEELRRRSRQRLLQATVDLVDEHGYEATTLADIADRAGAARGLVSYYFPGKRQLLQSAVHRLMHTQLSAALARAPHPTGEDAGRELLARAIDAILGLARDRPRLMRTHMAGILQAEGFIQCPEQQQLATALRDTVIAYGCDDPDTDYRLLRALLMGAVVAVLLPGAPMPTTRLRAELFQRYGLDWELGDPPPPEEDRQEDRQEGRQEEPTESRDEGPPQGEPHDALRGDPPTAPRPTDTSAKPSHAGTHEAAPAADPEGPAVRCP